MQIGRPFVSLTTCSLEFIPALVRRIYLLYLLLTPQTGNSSVCIQMGCVDHNRLGILSDGGPRCEHLGKHTQSAPTHPLDKSVFDGPYSAGAPRQRTSFRLMNIIPLSIRLSSKRGNQRERGKNGFNRSICETVVRKDHSCSTPLNTKSESNHHFESKRFNSSQP